LPSFSDLLVQAMVRRFGCAISQIPRFRLGRFLKELLWGREGKKID
jgi:hypothetical protein